MGVEYGLPIAAAFRFPVPWKYQHKGVKMNFNFGEVLTRAWQIIWKHKVLWIFGVFAQAAAKMSGRGKRIREQPFRSSSLGSTWINDNLIGGVRRSAIVWSSGIFQRAMFDQHQDGTERRELFSEERRVVAV
jgi:hypothetical protein